MSEIVISTTNLHKSYGLKDQQVHALRGVDISIKGEVEVKPITKEAEREYANSVADVLGDQNIPPDKSANGEEGEEGGYGEEKVIELGNDSTSVQLTDISNYRKKNIG